MNEKLIDYFKRGMERGYSLDHIKQVLISNGHDRVDVSLVANYLKQEQQPSTPQEPQKPAGRKGISISPIVVIIGILAVMSIATGMFLAFGDSPTGAAVTNPQEKADRLSEISKMDEEIDASQRRLKSLSDELEQKELTIEEKNEIIQQQIEEIDNIQSQIEEQRQTIRDFLLELLNDMLKEETKG